MLEDHCTNTIRCWMMTLQIQNKVGISPYIYNTKLGYHLKYIIKVGRSQYNTELGDLITYTIKSWEITLLIQYKFGRSPYICNKKLGYHLTYTIQSLEIPLHIPYKVWRLPYIYNKNWVITLYIRDIVGISCWELGVHLTSTIKSREITLQIKYKFLR